MLDVSKFERGRARYAVVWARFVQRIQQPDVDFICIFEGNEDVRYYPPRIEQFCGRYPENIIIGHGKGNVLRLREEALTLEEFRLKVRAAFFIDRDFDTTLETTDGTYVTPGYSIENLHAHPQAIERFLVEEIHLVDAADADDKGKALTLYEDWLATFASAILPHCIWLKLQAAEVTKVSDADRKTLKDNFIAKIVDMKWSEGGLRINTLVKAEDLHTVYPEFPEIAAVDIQREIENTRESYGAIYQAVRGKFLLPFLKIVLANFIEDSNRRENRVVFSTRRKCALQITEATVASALSRFAHTPDCLKEFLSGLTGREGPR